MKRNKKTLLIIFSLIIAIIVLFFFYPKITGQVAGNQQSLGSLKNPVAGLTDEQAEKNFDETYVRYILYSIGLNNLKSAPLSRETPKIEIEINAETYNAEIIKGNIKIEKGEIEKEDIIIRTTKQEIIKSMREKEYLRSSLKNGLTNIQLVATKTELLAKGYLNIYKQLSTA